MCTCAHGDQKRMSHSMEVESSWFSEKSSRQNWLLSYSPCSSLIMLHDSYMPLLESHTQWGTASDGLHMHTCMGLARPCQSRIQKSSHRSLSWLIRKGTLLTVPVVVGSGYTLHLSPDLEPDHSFCSTIGTLVSPGPSMIPTSKMVLMTDVLAHL